MQDFERRVVLVTGATGAIGRAAAVQLAARGAHVIAAGRREEQGRATVRAAQAAGGSAEFAPLDIADAASIDALFAHIEARHGRLDAAFNNAGIEADASPLPDTPIEVFDQVMATNVRGTWLCLRHELRIMRAQGSGAIVNTASIAGVVGFPEASVYTASKHAIVGMTKAAGLELAAQGIRVNCLLPGATRSEMSARWAERYGGEDTMASFLPIKRLSTPDEQANVAVFLLSDAASYMTSANVVVDGGYSVP